MEAKFSQCAIEMRMKYEAEFHKHRKGEEFWVRKWLKAKTGKCELGIIYSGD